MSDLSVEQRAQIEVMGSLGKHLGPLILGLAADAVLFGICANQFSTWLMKGSKESPHVRFLLYLACFGALAGTIFTWATTMHMFVYEYGSFAQFISCDWTAWYGILDPLTKISIQAFYAERAWRINRRCYPLLVAIGICLCCSVTGSVGYTITSRTKTMDTFDKTADIFFYLWPGGCIGADVLITSSIMWGLYRSRTGFERTDALVKRLMMISLEAQVPPTLVALLFFIQFTKTSMSTIVQFIATVIVLTTLSYVTSIVHPKVYLTGCLVILNSRENMRQDQTTYVHTSDNNCRAVRNHRLEKGSITVSTETYVHSDGGSSETPFTVGLNRSFSGSEKVGDAKLGLESPASEHGQIMTVA